VTTPSNPYGSEGSGKHSADGAANNGAGYNAAGQDQTQDLGQGGQSYGQDYGQPFGQDSTQAYPQGSYEQSAPGAYDQYGQQNPQGGFGQDSNANNWAAYPNQTIANSTGADKDGFFSALFDFSFTRYVTPSVVKVLYTLLMIVVGLFVVLAIIGLLAAMAQDSSSILLVIIALPLVILGAIAWLAFYRVGLEVAVSIIRTAQSVQSIDERQARNSTIGS